MTRLATHPRINSASRSSSILIRGGMLVDPAQKIHHRRDLLIVNVIISMIEPEIDVSEEMNVVDASDLVVIPGLVDLRCHLREPGEENSETIESGRSKLMRS